ncbi:MAG TPA: aquaporin [Terracidiphilus sp.]|nr:aquaporin [Terracidiphilus sp.]
MKKYVMELIGTFFLVFTIGMSVLAGGNGVIPPLAIGSILMVMIYAGGHISGGHYNPAVTLGVWIRGKLENKDVLPYMLFQIVGAGMAALVVLYLMPVAQPQPRNLALVPELIAEFLFTFALVFVVLNSATSKDNSGNSFYGLAIGFTVMAGAFAVGGVASAAFNPAVAVGISVMGMSVWSKIWVYLVANLLGGAVAGWAFRGLAPEAEAHDQVTAQPRTNP